MKNLPFIGTSQSKLLLIGSVIGIVLILGLTSFMSLNEVEAQSSTEAEQLSPQVPGDQSIILLPMQETSEEDDDQPLAESSLVLEAPEEILAIDAATCIPADAERQTASVIDVVDADSISVLINENLETIKYLGVDTQPLTQSLRQHVLAANQALVGQTVTLVMDDSNADDEGRLLRYVFTDNAFINLALVKNGLATALSTPPDEACANEFKAAQELATSQEIGTWAPLQPVDWREWPIVPDISENAVEIYLRGLEGSVNPESFSVVGDCLSIPERLFRKVSWGDFSLPPELEHLQSTVEQFEPVWNRQPVTVEGGFIGASMFSMYFSDPDRCGKYETPIDCEFRINNPSMVIISLGTDQKPGTEVDFEFYMREIIEYSIERDVLPIIATKADPTAEDFPLNHIMAQLAYEYDIPLLNFWAAVQHLPNTALNPVTGIHLTAEGNAIRRLSALQVLHAVVTAAGK